MLHIVPRSGVRPVLIPAFAALLAMHLVASRGLAWDYEGHRLVNQLALASLPTNFPAFALSPEARERIAFLAGEADRWRNSPDLTLKHCNGPDHYFDMDDLSALGMEPARLSPFRYVFTAQLAAARAAHPGKLEPIDAAKDADQTKALFGYLPWTIAEYYGKLKSGFSSLREFEAAGTPEEIANARQNILYIMGVMGHFVGDAAQPLHTTKHYNGWVGDNPKRYTTNKTFHSWIDGGYFNKVGVERDPLFKQVRAARPLADTAGGLHTNLFPVVMTFLAAQFQKVEPLYQLDKEYRLPGRTGVDPKGYEFMTRQLLEAGQMLGDLWFTAWQHAPPDMYLRSALARRKLKESGATAKETPVRSPSAASP
jgi:hypothetical protein